MTELGRKKISINKLEEIAVGKTINGETIVSNKNDKVSTVIEDQILNGKKSGLTWKKHNYLLINYNLLLLSNRTISESKYNEYLDSIK